MIMMTNTNMQYPWYTSHISTSRHEFFLQWVWGWPYYTYIRDELGIIFLPVPKPTVIPKLSILFTSRMPAMKLCFEKRLQKLGIHHGRFWNSWKKECDGCYHYFLSDSIHSSKELWANKHLCVSWNNLFHRLKSILSRACHTLISTWSLH